MSPLARRTLRHRRVRAGVILLGTLGLMAVLAPTFAPYDPAHQIDLATLQMQAPSPAHPFGTDFYSRDVLSRVLHGARISLAAAVLAVAVSVTLGTIVGSVAGMAGGLVDTCLMRVVDAGLAIPRIFLILVILSLWDDVGLAALIAILGLTSWFPTSRLVRAEILSVRRREYVDAARNLGVPALRLYLRHLLPNVAAPIIVTAALGMGHMILIEAGLSYLGVGVRPPTASWGGMIHEGQALLATAPWISIFPGVALVITVIGFSILGDGLRDALDPRSGRAP